MNAKRSNRAACFLLWLTVSAGMQAQDFTYTNIDGAITILRYTGPGGEVTVPHTITGLPVRTIGWDAFMFMTTVTSITVPDSVTNLGGYAFYGCNALTNITLPNTITTIPEFCFLDSGLTCIEIPHGVTRIEAAAFTHCTNLTTLSIPDTVVSIDDGAQGMGWVLGAFASCPNLTNVVIGNSLTNLGNVAFQYCTNLTSVYFRGNAPRAGLKLFDGAPNTVAYYLPGTTGWGPTFGDRPAVLWNPQALTGDGRFGVGVNGFGFNISGTPDIPLLIEANANPAGNPWVPLKSCTLTNGLIYFSDPQWRDFPSRFYRIRSP